VATDSESRRSRAPTRLLSNDFRIRITGQHAVGQFQTSHHQIQRLLIPLRGAVAVVHPLVMSIFHDLIGVASSATAVEEVEKTPPRLDTGNAENQRDAYGIGHYAVVTGDVHADSWLLLLLLVLVETPNRSTVSRFS